MVEPDWSQMKM